MARGWTYRGRWALVTGASSGIGEAFARLLAERGMHLVLAARREERLRELATELSAAHGVEVAVVAVDLGAPGAAERLWTEATAGGREIDLLINNAGFGLYGRFDEQSLERQAEMVQVNCVVPLELAHPALRAMRARRSGAIINVASTAAFQPIPFFATYAASKAFLLSLSEALWDEARQEGVRVLALCPGTTPTEFQQVAGTKRNGRMPGTLTAREVALAALRAMERGKGYVVPGAPNALSARLVRLLPLSLATRAARIVMARL